MKLPTFNPLGSQPMGVADGDSPNKPMRSHGGIFQVIPSISPLFYRTQLSLTFTDYLYDYLFWSQRSL